MWLPLKRLMSFAPVVPESCGSLYVTVFIFLVPRHFIHILCFTVFETLSSLPPTPTEAGGIKLCEYNDFMTVVSLVDFLVTVHGYNTSLLARILRFKIRMPDMFLYSIY